MHPWILVFVHGGVLEPISPWIPRGDCTCNTLTKHFPIFSNCTTQTTVQRLPTVPAHLRESSPVDPLNTTLVFPLTAPTAPKHFPMPSLYPQTALNKLQAYPWVHPTTLKSTPNLPVATVMNHHKFSGLKCKKFEIIDSFSSESQKTKIKVPAGSCSPQRLQGRICLLLLPLLMNIRLFWLVVISVQSLLDGHIAFFSVKSASAFLLGGHYGYN